MSPLYQPTYEREREGERERERESLYWHHGVQPAASSKQKMRRIFSLKWVACLDAVALASDGIIAVGLLSGFKHEMLICVIRVVYGVCHLLERVVNAKGKMTVFFLTLLIVVQVVRTKSVKGVIVLKMPDTTGYVNFHQSDVPLAV